MITKPFFSIIIPTLNEEKYVPLLLKDFAKQTFTDFEVIIVDGQSEDKTIKKALSFATKYAIDVETSSKRSVAFQRNLGAKKATGSWVIFMDADNRIPTYFLQGLKYQLEKHPDTDLFSCWFDGEAYSLADRPIMELANITIEVYSKVKPLVAGALIGVKRSLTRKLQFDETLTLSEDHDFVLQAVKSGYTFKLFREPRYVFSLRRLRREGKLKVARVYAKAQLYYLMGKKMTEPQTDYIMGGDGYSQNSNTWRLNQIVTSFSKASQKQLQQARDLIKSLSLPNF